MYFSRAVVGVHFPFWDYFAFFDEGTCAARRLLVFSWNCARGRY